MFSKIGKQTSNMVGCWGKFVA